MSTSLSARLLGAITLLVATSALAKPIAFQDGRTLMFEYGAGTMIEAQAFYAPRYWYSVGAGYLHLEDEDHRFSRDISYARMNYLVHRWNLSSAQANVFAWGGLGGARATDSDLRIAENAGGQADFETLWFYSSLKTDWQHSSAFSHRIDTLQLGVAPYRHRYNGIATWVVGQARRYTGDIYDGTEVALLLRFFRGPLWIEAGITADRKLQSMVMFNF
ncbi:MAG TPA: hypothetical protein VFB36_12260 [Nevskiaceae bacterium]|nr:hypothetical protein [Nevskiaceae bacterium]